ncbi:MAG: hypothetical protein ACRDH2_15980, partial [Anaerolineales bacterium]
QQEYVRLVANAYALDPNPEAARQRIALLCGLEATAICPEATLIVSDTRASATGNDQARLLALQSVLQAPGAPVGSTEPQRTLLQRFGLPLACGLLVFMLVLGGGAFLYLRSAGLSRGAAAPARSSASAPARRVVMDVDQTTMAPEVVTAAPTGAVPVAQWMTTYVLGDDVYDDSFSIDGPDGNFLGECGMGISETIGVGDPKKVMAFEVWLFDKNDIRTVTKVLMSEHAFRDEALKSRLAAKGEPVQIKTGDVVTLDTATLTVTARVVDMAYGGGALPPNSFFERLTIELAAFQKQPAG